MAGRSGQCAKRQGLGRWLAPTGSCLLSGHPSSFDLYRWVECVSKEHQACISRKGEKDSRRGRACLEVWPDLCIATVIKRTEKKRVVEITRKITRGPVEKAQELLKATKGCQEFNTSFIERFNGTMRERLASLTRKCRHAVHRLEVLDAGMFLIGCTY